MALARYDCATRIATLSLLCATAFFGATTPALAEETTALKLIRNVQSLQAQYGNYAREVLPPLVELGQLYGAGQCNHALDILDLALEVSRRSEGLLHPQQLEIYAPLMSCYLTLNRIDEFARAQHYVLLINEAQYGQNDPHLLPSLAAAAKRYEEGGLYFSARRLHRRAVEIAEHASGRNDPSLVAPLRGLAHAYRLEYIYGLALPDITDETYLVSTLRSNAGLPGDFRFDRLGEESLERAVKILRRHPDSKRELIETLVELGDWHQLAGHNREALTIYRQAWRELHAPDAPDSDLLRTATPLQFRPRTGAALRRTPLEDEGLHKYTIDLEYTVTGEGRVKDIRVLESNASPRVQHNVVEDLRYTRHRPGFAENGEPIEERGLQYRRHVYSKKAPKRERETETLAATSVEREQPAAGNSLSGVTR